MRILDAEAICSLASMPRLVTCLEEAFRSDWTSPPRQVVALPGVASGRLFISMPAFGGQGCGAVKLATLFPDNPSKGLPTIQSTIVVFSDAGTPVAVLDGAVITQLRTGAASALASKYLSREDSAHLALAGTGALAPYMALGHCAVRPIRHISVWGRSVERAVATVASICELVRGVEVNACDCLEGAVETADVVCCATRSQDPLLFGKWLRPGTFVDLVGSFAPTDRETDDDVVRRSRIFVDTHEGALAEAGDLLDPISRGIITKEKIEGDLSDLVRGRVKGRTSDGEITLFKSVGTAIEDTAAAQMIVEAALGQNIALVDSNLGH